MKAVVFALLGACYSAPDIAPCTITCSTSSECPGDLECDGQLCTNEATTCDGTCIRDRFDSTSSPWQEQPGTMGNLTVGVVDQVLRFFVAANTTALATYTRPAVDLTNGAITIELVQAFGNGNDRNLMEFALATPNDHFGIHVVGGNVGTAILVDGVVQPGATMVYDPAYRYLKIESTTEGVVLAISADRSTWMKLAGPVAPSQPLTNGVPTIRIDGTKTQSTDPNPAAAELDNFEIVTGGCTPGAYDPLVRDLFREVDVTPLTTHLADIGGAWTAAIGTATVLGDGMTPDSNVSRYFVGDPGIDYDVEADITQIDTTGPAKIGVLGRAGAGPNYYFGLGVTASAATFAELGEVDADPTIPCNNPPMVGVGATHRIRLRLRGTALIPSVDGVNPCPASESAGSDQTSGPPGFHFQGTPGVWRVDNLIVTDPAR